ncbi:PST family polysaccharide transporter [Loktanella ponticola]|uniref:PST family polysaccharide transporter n=1 Tax=Yoonia ponticola TaxID=1524255 RepID=A0A7W9BN93_9RHOB|nr:oligosaccharide flippase family protein [Yoonia ponticola]MBB5723657.1 PST family polysaccharide transporter [Yoonia ponticola]
MHTPHDPRDAFFDVSDLSADLGRRTGRSAASVVIFAVLKLFIAVGATAIMARLVPPAQQGLVAMAIPFVLIAVGLSEFGLAQAITQMQRVTHHLASTLFWVNVALGAILTILIAAAGPFAGQFFDQPQVTVIFWVLSPYIFLSVLNTQYIALLRRRMQVRLLESCIFYATLIASCLAVFIAFMGYGIAALITQLLAQQALTFAMLVTVTGWTPSRPWGLDLRRAKAALSFGGFLAAERILNDSTRAIQIAVISRVFGDVGAGLFYRTETFALMPQRRLVSPLSAAFIPSLSRLQDNAAAFRTMLSQQITRGNVILMPVGAVFCTSPDLVVAVLLGPDWTAAVPILAWLGVLALTGLSLSCYAWALVAAGRSRDLFLFRVCSTVMILAAITLTYPHGLIPMIRAYVLTFAILSLPLLCLFVVRATVITTADVLQNLRQTTLFAAALLGAGFGIRTMLDSTVIIEGIAAIAAITAVVALRLGADRQLLRDVKTTLRP